MFFFFNDTATTEIYTLSLHDALPIYILDRFVNGIGKGTDISAEAITWTEKHVVYAGLNVVGYANHLLARSWRKLQSGMVHHYAAIIIIGLAIMIHLVVLWYAGSSSAGSSMY